MKNYFPLFLLIGICLSAQEITDKKEFRKCRKVFSKKICLSDEDKDSSVYYLDKCPKENGPAENVGCPFPDTDADGIPDTDDACPDSKGEAENNGCPWPDTDGDGISDNKDACPTIQGVPEEMGCPGKGDCTEYFKKEEEALSAFKKKNADEKQKFSALRRAIFRNIPKELLAGKSMYVSVYVHTFINDNFNSQCSSRSTLFHDKSRFLDQLFWSEEAFKSIAKHFHKNLIPTIEANAFRTIGKDLLKGIKEDDDYFFMLNFPEITSRNRTGIYYPGNKEKPEFDISSTRLAVDFVFYESKDEVTAKFYKVKDEYFYTYQYIDHQWKLITTEKHRN